MEIKTIEELLAIACTGMHQQLAFNPPMAQGKFKEDRNLYDAFELAVDAKIRLQDKERLTPPRKTILYYAMLDGEAHAKWRETQPEQSDLVSSLPSEPAIVRVFSENKYAPDTAEVSTGKVTSFTCPVQFLRRIKED